LKILISVSGTRCPTCK